MAAVSLAFDILARDKASQTFNKVGKSVDDVGRKAKTSGSLFSGLGKTFIGVAAGIGAASLFKSFISEAEESRRVSALTAAAIKSTGGAANVTAGQISTLATAISNKTGVDDEAIQSASNLLLTFTNVRNEVGKGNDIFNQATQAATDMAAVLGGDAAGQSIALGKALNNPIKGLTALTRVGVSFTEQQKNQIKTLVKSGDTLGAQKIILSELGKEFGGAAAAAATPTQKLAVIMGNLKESIGTALLPVVDRLANFIGGTLVPAFVRFVAVAREQLGPVIAQVGGFLGRLRAHFTSAGDGTTSLRERFVAVAGYVRGTLIPAVQGIIATVVQKLTPAFRAYAEYITGTVIPGFQKLAAKVNENKAPVIALLQAFGKFAGFVAQFVLPIVIKVGAVLVGTLFSAIAKVIGIIGGAIRIFLAFGTAIGVAAFKATQAFTAVVTFVKSVPGKIKAALGNVGSLLFNAGRDLLLGLVRGMRAGISAAVNAAKAVASGVKNAITGFFRISSPSKVMHEVGGHIVKGLANGLAAAKRHAEAEANKVAAAIKKALVTGLRLDIKNEKSLAGQVRSQIGALTKEADRLKGLQQTFKDFKTSVVESIKGFASLGNLSLGDNPGRGGLISGLVGKLSDIQKFATLITSLRSGGLNNGLLQQLIGAGPGSDLAKAFGDNLTGDDIKTLNGLQSQIDAQANAIGNTAVTSQFGSAPAQTAAQLASVDQRLAAANGHLAAISREIKDLDKKLASALNGVASTASRDGKARVAR